MEESKLEEAMFDVYQKDFEDTGHLVEVQWETNQCIDCYKENIILE